MKYVVYEGASYEEAVNKMTFDAYNKNIVENMLVIKKFKEEKKSFFGLRKKMTFKIIVGIMDRQVRKKQNESPPMPRPEAVKPYNAPPVQNSLPLAKENKEIREEVNQLKDTISQMESLIKTQFTQMQQQMLSQKVSEEVSKEKKLVDDLEISKKNIQWTESYLTQREFSQDLIKDVVQHLSRQPKDILIDKSQILTSIRNFLLKSIVREEISIEHYKYGNTILFAGPTGVGKTVTIVKMAAHIAAMREKSMRFISVDRYKVGADSQLKTYSEYLKAPFYPITQVEDFFAILKNKESDFTFIDTAGKSPRETIAIKELADWIQKSRIPIDIHLVVSATTKPADLDFIVNNYQDLNFNHIIATKLDETVYLGSILSVLYKTGKSLSFVTNGQEVPQDFEIANVEKMINDSLK